MLYNGSAENLTVLQYLLYKYINQAEKFLQDLYESNMSDMVVDSSKEMTTRGLKMTITMISIVPILCVYPFMQRFLIKGIMIGAVKG